VDVSQEIKPNHADRFEFAVQNPDPDLATHLYRLGISLVRDGGSGTVDAGVVVVAAPFLNAGPLSRDVLTYPGEVGECYRRLTAEYERAESWAGKKTPEFSQPLFGER
jgi:hypothetical protein